MSLAKQMKKRRHQLNLQQKDMKLRIGMEQQQYSRIEAGGNANLKNLELIAEGLNAELMLIPKEKRTQILALLEESRNSVSSVRSATKTYPPEVHQQHKQINVIDDPWEDILD